MAQRYLPEIRDGDKRILMIKGEPVPWCLARLPAGRGDPWQPRRRGHRPGPATERAGSLDCRTIAPTLVERGLLFVGLDVIGDYLTEINVTSPTCIRELDDAQDLDIGGQLMECLEIERREGVRG